MNYNPCNNAHYWRRCVTVYDGKNFLVQKHAPSSSREQASLVQRRHRGIASLPQKQPNCQVWGSVQRPEARARPLLPPGEGGEKEQELSDGPGGAPALGGSPGGARAHWSRPRFWRSAQGSSVDHVAASFGEHPPPSRPPTPPRAAGRHGQRGDRQAGRAGDAIPLPRLRSSCGVHRGRAALSSRAAAGPPRGLPAGAGRRGRVARVGARGRSSAAHRAAALGRRADRGASVGQLVGQVRAWAVRRPPELRGARLGLRGQAFDRRSGHEHAHVGAPPHRSAARGAEKLGGARGATSGKGARVRGCGWRGHGRASRHRRGRAAAARGRRRWARWWERD